MNISQNVIGLEAAAALARPARVRGGRDGLNDDRALHRLPRWGLKPPELAGGAAPNRLFTRVFGPVGAGHRLRPPQQDLCVGLRRAPVLQLRDLQAGQGQTHPRTP